ncbi:uncharacterized protein LOC5520843 isoform X2 [Nematostella vectensis]|uniref:uncharacterized protein LOC5520843 isoform X2 n=1 Tax=Nematostella vectensis TaxID=45351 RepID=UPI002077939B|nr:uncharacterized protein LOC5520843 isoform X2 [Nematostella vectensis]
MKAPHSLYILVAITFRATLCQDSCNKPLGLEDERIKDAQFTALTAYDENIKVYGPQRARLNLLKWPQGYRGNPKSQENSWVSVDFGRGVVITGIATQGYGERGIQEWVSMFMLMYSTQEDDNEKTLAPADRSSEWLFQGNYDASTVVRQSILRPVIASRVKLIPIEWHTNVGLRMELFGCDADYYMDAWLLYRDTSFRMAYSIPSSNEYQTMANSTEKLLSNYFDVNYVTGYLKTKFMEFSPQTSTSGLTNLAAKIRFYCLRTSRETLMRELNIFVSAPDSTFENEITKLRFSKLDCKPPKINIKPSVDTPKIVGVIRRSFPVFTVSIRQDCPSNDNLLIYWQIATLANSRKVLSPLSPPQHLNINKFLLLPEMYPMVDTLYIRCVALLQGFQWTFSMDDRFIKLIDADVVAKVQGPSIAIRGISDIELDASHSYLTTSSEWAKRVILTYSWYCFGPVMDKRIDQAGKVKCSPKGERLGIATEALHINASDLVEGNYAFQMIVEADGVTSVAVQNVTVYGFQGLSIRCQSNCGRKINSQITGILEAECRGSVCSLQRRYLWSAVYTESASEKWREVNLTNDPYSSRISLTNLPEILNTSTNIDKPFIIKVRAFFGDSAQITSTADFILNSVPATDYTGEAGCFVNVRQGYAMKTKFQISCERWQDEDMPLSYKFQYLSEFGNIILQSGYLANASAELLPGNATLDYMVDIECVVVDSLGASATVKLPVKVLPPSESEVKSLLKNIKNTLSDLIESGDQDKAADMSLFSLSVMKTRNNSAKEEAEIKANILDEMADIVVQTLPQVTKFAVLGAETTHQDWPMSNKTKKNALNLITKTANTLKNLTSEGNMGIDADLVKNVAEIFIDGVSNVLLSAIPDNEVDISHKCANVSQTIARTFATLKAVGIGSVSITSKAITINVNRDTPLAFDRVSTRTGRSTLMLPPSVTLFPNTSATPPSIDLQVIQFVANPFFGDPSQVSVNSEVLDVSLYVESFGELKVKNLQPPINLFIPLKRKHQNESKMQSPSHFVKPTLNASNTMNMTFHRIFITSEYVNLTVTLKPEAGSYVDVFVKPAVRPSYDQYVFKKKIPDLNACFDSKLSPWNAVDGCKRDPFSFDINSKITGAKGLHFIGVRFQPLKGKESSDTELNGMPNLDESSHNARIVRRNNQIEFSCKSSNGRQKRACVGVKDPPPTPPRPTQVFYPVYDSTTDVNYTLQISMASCVYWDHARGTWSSDGCTIGKQSNTSHVHCLCNHLTPFGGDFLIAPNPIDFDKVLMEFSRLGETGNVLVLVMVCVLWAVYLLGLMVARRADVNDISKELCSTLINSEDSSSAAYYKITIFTGVWKGCGTTSSVGMTLYGDRDNSRPFYFNNSTKGPSFFSRGSVTSFIVKCRTLGNIFRVELWHDNSGPNPSWFIDRIEIAEEHSGKYWYFLARRWLAVHKEGIHVTLPISDISDLRKFKNIFYSRASKQFCDAHLWLSIFTRTTQSPFTRCQRLACCFLIVFGSMVVNAMFYQFGKQTDDDFHVGPVRVSLSGIKIGVQSALMLLPVTTLVVLIFKNIKQQRITLSLGDPEALEKITVGCLPAGATWIAWLICLSGSAASSVFTVFYSLVWGAEISNQWLISTMVSFVEDIFFIQPVKLIILSCLLAWIIKPDLGKEKDSFTSHCVLLRHEEVSLPAARKLKKCRERKVKRRWLTATTIEIAAFLFFVYLVFVVCYGRRDSRMFTMTESVKGHFPEFQEVEGPSSFWKWTSDVLLPALYDKKQNAALDEGFIGNGKLFLVGMPRIRQLRVVSSKLMHYVFDR